MSDENVAHLVHGSNVHTPGAYVYRVDESQIMNGTGNTKFNIHLIKIMNHLFACLKLAFLSVVLHVNNASS